MSLESGREYSLEELKRLNASPSTEPLSPTPPIEVHPTQEEWHDLLTKLSALYRVTTAQNELLTRLVKKPIIYATPEQAEEITRQLSLIRTILEQAGKLKERRFSLRLPKPHLPRLSPALLLIPAILLVLWAAWSSWGTLWNAIRTLLL